jgi:signal transduction histidine kinase
VAKIVDKFYKDAHANVFNFSYSVLAILLLITVGITYVFYQSARNKDTTRFENETSRVQSAITNRIKLYIGLLNSGRAFIESTSDLSSSKFAAYAGSLDIGTNYAGLRSLGFVKTVRAEDIGGLTEKMNVEGRPDFRIFPEAQKEEYQALIYVEPQEELSRRAIGFDMSSEPARHEALRRSGEAGTAIASGPVVPIISTDETGNETRIIIFRPVYKEGPSFAAPDSSQKTISGYIYGSFIAQTFVGEINKEVNNKDISVNIYDSEVSPNNLLAKTNDQPETGFISIPNEIYAHRDEIPVAGRKWIIEYGSLSSFNSQSSLGWTPLIFISGVCISFLLFGMTYREASARVKLQKTAAQLFEMQKQKEMLFEQEQKSRLEAEQASVAKDEFIAIISHELKTPLNAIAGWTRILKTHDISAATKDMALVKIDKNLRAQVGLVEQLVTYSEIISANIDLGDTHLNFGEVAEEAIREVAPLAEEKGIELSTENRLNGDGITGDKDRLKIVLNCVLLNAIKFTPPGGKIETELSRAGEMVELSVKDSGRGIPTELIPFIFDQYKQADTPNIRDYGGLGLGLTISKHIVSLHGGTIEAHSDGKDMGSRFVLQFPVKKD